jgi:crotonobetainyl-CoA:carnitine CoA-transferase CaiB-like acyl-CoA transferase
VQTSLIEAGINLLDFQAARWLVDGNVPPQEGNYHPTITPMGLYPTADSYVNIAATSNGNFGQFCKLIDRSEMAADPRFASAGLRARNKEVLNELIAEAMRHRTSREWFDIMVAAGLPCGPVYDIKEVFEDPQVEALHIARPVRHSRLGDINLVAQPCEISGFDRAIRHATPDLGEHTVDILEAIGLECSEIEQLRAKKVI